MSSGKINLKNKYVEIQNPDADSKTLCITNSHEVFSGGDIIQLEDQFIYGLHTFSQLPQGTLDLVSRAVHDGVQHGAYNTEEHRELVIHVQGVPFSLLVIVEVGHPIKDHHQSEVGCTGREGLAPALSRGNPKDGPDDEYVGPCSKQAGAQTNGVPVHGAQLVKSCLSRRASGAMGCHSKSG
jgi:hypothetical protein